jgi:hypothetical protein
MEPVAERVADHLVSHHPGMPCVGQAQQTVGTTRGLVYRLHVPRARRCVWQAIAGTAPADGRPLLELVLGSEHFLRLTLDDSPVMVSLVVSS